MSPRPLVVPPDETALVLIEFQEGIIGSLSVLPTLAEEAASIVPTLARLVRGAREANVQVVHLLYCPVADNRSSNRKPVMASTVLARQSDWTLDHPAVQVPDEIGIGPNDLVLVRHSGLSPTHGTETFKILRNLGISVVVIAGVSTNIAVPVVSVEAVDEGFSVIVPRDAVAGTPRAHSESMLVNSIAPVAHLTTTEALLDLWET